MENIKDININRKNIIKALLSYTHTPKDYLREIYNLNNKDLLFHLENFCLLCKDDFKSILSEFNCIKHTKNIQR